MVERLFCFSKELAERNGIKIDTNNGKGLLTVAALLLIIFPVILINIVIFLESAFSALMILACIIVIAVACICFYKGIFAVKETGAVNTVFAIDNNKKIYMVNYAEVYPNEGMNGVVKRNNLPDKILTYEERVVQNILNPEQAAAIITEILRVNSYNVSNNYVEIYCECKITEPYRGIRIENNKRIRIYRCYVAFDELMNMLIGGM